MPHCKEHAVFCSILTLCDSVLFSCFLPCLCLTVCAVFSTLNCCHVVPLSVSAAENDLLPVSCQPSDPNIFNPLSACCSNRCQSFHLSPFPLPPARPLSSSVAATK